MTRWISSLATCAALLIGQAAFAPDARAQCTWGCTCLGSACGCNSNGNGGRCDASGSGCVVTRCTEKAMLYFAPDGSVIRLAFADGDPASEQPQTPADVPQAELGGTTRWEAARDGRSVARHCSGVVVARYYAAAEAAALRDASRTLRL